MILGTVLAIAAFYDYNEDRIPNWLCLTGGMAGLLVSIYWNGIFGSFYHLFWVAGIFCVLLPLWLIRVIGAGDVKLLMTAALFLGKEVLSFLLCAGICTGLHAFLLMIKRRNYFARMTLFFRYVMLCVKERRAVPYPFDRERDSEVGGIRISYGMLAGHVLALGMGLYGI